MASVLPEATYYDKTRAVAVKDSFIFVNPKFNSSYNSARFEEGDEIIVGFVADQPGMSILLDIKCYNPDRDRFEDYGYSICPMLQDLNTDGNDDSLELYVNSGVFVLPVYKGRIQEQLVEMLL